MPEQIAADLAAAVDEMIAEVTALPAPLIEWAPAADAWSVKAILCHVAEFLPFWTVQTLQVVERPGDEWGRDHHDTNRLAAVAPGAVAAQTLAGLCESIRQSAIASGAVLGPLTEEQLATEATSRNPRWGVKPAQFIVDNLIVGHVRKHIIQIRRNAAQFLDQEATLTETIFPPIPQPSLPVAGWTARFPIHRIFCVGRNYEAHAKEMGHVVDREAPFYFTKAACHCVPSGATVPYPPGTKSYHHEMELVVAIGKAGFRISEAAALDHVFGYACGLDMTRRDLQAAAKEKQRPWDLGKDVEQSAVAGEVVPAAVSGHPSSGRIELRVNGETRQSADISSLIHPVPAIIAHLSQYYHLEPGDLIYTGTPEGVGAVRPGDRLEGSIEGVGTIALTLTDAE